MKALAEIKDPEVGLDIVAMGLIYGAIERNDDVLIKMTMTTPYCPLKEYFIQEVTSSVKKLKNKKVKIDFIFEPLWSPKMINQEE